MQFEVLGLKVSLGYREVLELGSLFPNWYTWDLCSSTLWILFTPEAL